MAESSSSGTARSKRVTFDEDVIREHDKDRGTRMVIPDPDTPFLRGYPDDDEVDTSTGGKSHARIDPASLLAGAVSAYTEAEAVEAKKRAEFIAHRKAFYNEGRVLKGIEHPPPPQ